MSDALIVDFPARSRSSRSVEFADTAELYIVSRHDDNVDVDRQDLWYAKADYALMARANRSTIIKFREMPAAVIPTHHEGSHRHLSNDCLIGIEHLLTPATILEFKTCRRRCVQAVLREQARQVTNPSSTSSWDSIALASIAETRKAVTRAKKLAEVLKGSM